MDPNKRDHIFAFELLTLWENLINNNGGIKKFPFSHNLDASKEIHEVLAKLANKIDNSNKSSFEFYAELGIGPMININKDQLAEIVLLDCDKNRAYKLHKSLEIANNVKFYYYLSCLETFSHLEIKPSTSSLINGFKDLALKFPESIKTKEFFGIDYNDIITESDFEVLMKSKLSANSENAKSIFIIIDERGIRKLYGFQIFTYFDLLRYCIEDGIVVRDMPIYPYFSTPNIEKSVRQICIRLADLLDKNKKSTFEMFFESIIDSNFTISKANFEILLSDLDQKSVCKIFEYLDIYKTEEICFYHFLAIVETYRNVFVLN